MKKLLIGVFAHPDDESFGPSGFLYTAAHTGTEVHLILMTSGDAGINDGYNNLGKTRLEEWRTAGKLIGATSQTYFGYPDGGLSNNLYEEICARLQRHVLELAEAHKGDEVQLDFLTFERGGISGHLDHIAVSLMTTCVFERFRQTLPKAVKLGVLRYFCLPSSLLPHPNANWLYMPAGRTAEEIDEVVNCKEIEGKKLEIMRVHVSQQRDMQRLLALRAEFATKDPVAAHAEHFMLYS